EDVGDLADVLAVAVLDAPLAGAVGGFHGRGDGGQLLELGRVARRRHRGADLDQGEGAGGVRALRRDVVELGLLDEAVGHGQGALVGGCGDPLAVGIDVGGLQPEGGGDLRRHFLLGLVDAGDELVGAFGGGGIGASVLGGVAGGQAQQAGGN